MAGNSAAAGFAARRCRIGRLAPGAAPLSQTDLMRWPGVVAEPLADPEAVALEVIGQIREQVQNIE